MKRTILVLIVLFTISLFATAQQAKDETSVPEEVKISLDGLLKTRTSNQVFKLSHFETYFYVVRGAVYVNVLFKAELEDDIKVLKDKLKTEYDKKKAKYDKFIAEKEKAITEENQKIEQKNKALQASKRLPLKTWEKPEAPKHFTPNSFHNLFIRVVREGKIIQHFKAPIPNDDNESRFYSFGLILAPGKHDILMNVDRFDNTMDGTLLVELEVPKMTLKDIITPQKKITSSDPKLFSKVKTLLVIEKRFNVAKNKFQVAPQKLDFFPVSADHAFKSGDEPILTFFMIGTTMVQQNPPWNITAKIELKAGKKTIAKYKELNLKNPYFFQPIKLVGKEGKTLDPGAYSLKIILVDKNSKGKKGVIEVPFKIGS